MKLACSTIMFGRFDLDTALREIAEAGFSAVELLCAGLPGRPAHLDVTQGKEYVEETKERVAEYGLDIASLVCYGSLTDQTHWNQVVRAMEMASALGATAVVDIAPSPQGDNPMAAFIELGKELGRIGAGLGVKFGIKPHLGLTVWSTPTLLQFLKGVASPWVGASPCPSHLWRAGEDPTHSLEAVREHIVTCYVRDCRHRDAPGMNFPGAAETQIPGHGLIALAAYCQKAKEIGTLKYLTLEIIGAGECSLEELRDMIDESRSYLLRCLWPRAMYLGSPRNL